MLIDSHTISPSQAWTKVPISAIFQPQSSGIHAVHYERTEY